MGSPALEIAGEDIDVTVVPGVTAALAVAAVLGAPLGHDHAMISLADLHTAWPGIERRETPAAPGEPVARLYQPATPTADMADGRVPRRAGPRRPTGPAT